MVTNNVNLIGRFVKEAEVREGSNTRIARFTLAVDRWGKKDADRQTDFISCVAFGNIAERIERYTTKGTKIALQGRIQTGSYENKDGKKVYTFDVIVDDFSFMESKGSKTEATKEDDGFIDVASEISEELPFR